MKLKELKKEFEANKTQHIFDIKEYVTTICVKKIDMYYSGWEGDTTAWVLNDGSMFTTNYGSLCEFSKKDFNNYRKQMKQVVNELDEVKLFLEKIETLGKK